MADDDRAQRSTGAWPVGWEAHARQRRAAWRETTPEERLAWLEDAIAFAAEVGTLPRGSPSASETS